MITKSMERALNGQINKGFYSAYLYLSMSAGCNKLGQRPPPAPAAAKA